MEICSEFKYARCSRITLLKILFSLSQLHAKTSKKPFDLRIFIAIAGGAGRRANYTCAHCLVDSYPTSLAFLGLGLIPSFRASATRQGNRGKPDRDSFERIHRSQKLQTFNVQHWPPESSPIFFRTVAQRKRSISIWQLSLGVASIDP
jgi:hypothetical protein